MRAGLNAGIGSRRNLGGGGPVYLPALNTLQYRGVWSPHTRLISSYSGSLITLVFNGTDTQTFGFASGSQRWDIAAILAWWQSRAGYTGYGGLMPRVSQMFNQGTDTTAHLVQTVDAWRPVLDFNNLRADGTCPVSFNGYGARSSTIDGTPLAVPEDNPYMIVAGAGLSFNTSNHGLLLAGEGFVNVGTSSSLGQMALVGMRTATAGDNFTLRVGKYAATGTSASVLWAGDYGVGVMTNTTNESPATTVVAPANRTLIMENHSTGSTIDGVTPTTSAVYNIRINNDLSTNQTQLTSVAQASGSGTAGTFTVGRAGLVGTLTAGGFVNGATWGMDGLVYVSNSLANNTQGDQRDAPSAAMMQALGVETWSGATVNLVPVGSSSVSGYQGNAGQGIFVQVARLLQRVTVSPFAVAGTSNAVIQSNAASFLPKAKRYGMQNWLIHLNARNELITGATGASVYATVVSILAAADTAGYDRKFVMTLWNSYGGSTISQAAYDAELAAYNALVMDTTNQTTYGYTAIDAHGLPELAVFTDPQYFDANPMSQAVHTRDSTGGSAVADLVATTLAPLVP